MTVRLLHVLVGVAATLALALPAEHSAAQGTRGRPVRLVVPLSPGTISDYAARLIAPVLGANLGESVVVENKVGANGLIGVQDVMKSPPDGTSLLLGSVSPLAINVALVKNLPYDPVRDLTAIGGAYSAHHVLVVKSTFPAKNFAEFIAYAKANSGKVAIGSSSTLVQVQVLAINKMAGIELLPVPYKNTAATFTDVLGGTMHMAFSDVVLARSQQAAGAIRVLAVTSLKRNPVAPDWPAVSETLPGFDFASWSAIVGPANMPRDVVTRLNGALVAAVKSKEVSEKLEQSGNVPWTTTPEELKSYIEAQTAKWIKLARDLNLQAE